MTEKDAIKLTKYFSEGVKAFVWCYADNGNWAISVSRDGGHANFYDLDILKRRLQFLRSRVLSGSKDLRLLAPHPEYPEDEIEFHSTDAAAACIESIAAAVKHIQSQTKDEDWFDVPVDVFDPIPLHQSTN